jgi:hypothetical protein
LISSAGSTADLAGLVGHNQSSHCGRGEGGHDTGDESRDSELSNFTTAGRSELAEDTDLNTQGADVAKTANSVGGDELGAESEALVVGILGKHGESIVLVLRPKHVSTTVKENGCK